MRRVAVAVVTGVLMIPVTAAPASAHDNNTQPCATPHEYDHIGMDESRDSVHNELDFNGSEVWQRDGREKRHYRVCDWVGYAYGEVPDNYYHVHVWYFYNGSFWEVYQKEWCAGGVAACT